MYYVLLLLVPYILNKVRELSHSEGENTPFFHKLIVISLFFFCIAVPLKSSYDFLLALKIDIDDIKYYLSFVWFGYFIITIMFVSSKPKQVN